MLYAVGLILSSYAVTPLAHQFLEILIGFGIAGMGFGVILAVIGRTTSEKNRSLALGIATSAGSLGQIIGPPVIEKLLQQMPWQEVFMVLAVIVMASMVLLPMIKSKPPTAMQGNDLSMSEVLGKALKDPSFAMIFLGFFSCGFQIAFITGAAQFLKTACSAVWALLPLLPSAPSPLQSSELRTWLEQSQQELLVPDSPKNPSSL